MFKQVLEIIQNQSDGTFMLLKSLSGAKPVVKIVRTQEQDQEESDEDIVYEENA